MNLNLAYPFYQSAISHPDSIALNVSGSDYSYGDVARRASNTATCLRKASKVGILASRSLAAYVGILGSCWSGATYVPLNPKFPDERLAAIFKRIDLDALLVDETGLSRLTPEIRAHAPELVLNLSSGLDLPVIEEITVPVHRGIDDLAYILFTSGTTGTPKGVMVTVGNVEQFLTGMSPRFCPGPSDRISQTSDLTFDVSVFEMFSAWGVGASVHVVPANQLMAPAKFITSQRLTVWSSVPSIAVAMRQMKMLKPGAFTSIRYSVFAGEAMPYALAKAWQAAAPNSVVENLYGPTEATIYCLGARVGPEYAPTPGRDTVPSGRPLPGIEAAILDESLAFVGAGQPGQLSISGGQIAKGYYGETAMTARSFRAIAGKVWYLTGDLAYQDERGIFHHLGRIDHQVKIQGQRVELEEVEAHLRVAAGCEAVAAVAWPVRDGLVSGIVAFTQGAKKHPEQLRKALSLRLPPYMVPKRIIALDSLPHGPSGKVDRHVLATYLDTRG